MKPPARCATWCRTMCSSCWRWWRWSRPPAFDAEAVRNPWADVVFFTMGEVKPEDAVRGQYGQGSVMGNQVHELSRGTRRRARYRAPRPSWPCGCTSANWRWAGVPFLRAHRQAPRHARDRDRHPIQARPLCAVHDDTQVETLLLNWLVLHIQPNEGDVPAIRGEAARTGGGPRREVRMAFHYDDWFPREPNVGLRDAAVRGDDRRPDVVQPRRHDRDRPGG